VEPLVADPDFTLYQGDVREVLRELPAESIHMVVTSPPYWGLRDYGTGEWEGGDAECDHLAPLGGGFRSSTLHEYDNGLTAESAETVVRDRRKQYALVCEKCGARRVDRQLGLEPTPEEYVANMVEVFREVRRVLRSDGTAWVNLGDSYNAATSATRKPTQTAEHGYWENEAISLRSNVTGLKPKDLVGIPWRVAQALQAPYYTGKIKDERERIWLAATVEAEGCLFIHKRKVGQSNGQGYERKHDSYGAGLEVASTDRVVVDRCMAITGLGSISEQTPAQNDRRKQTIYRWSLRSNVCREVIRELYPHFIAKQHEARLLLGCPSSGEDARKAHESLKAIHQGQEACIDFRPPEGMWEGGWFLRSEIIWAKLDRTPCLNP
jgi:hypothetical protein